MNYIYDLALNFNDCFDSLEFYEWSSRDIITNVEKIPVIRISRIMMNDILNKRIRIDYDILKKIKNKTIIDRFRTIPYGLLFTDLNRVIGLEFDEDGVVLKSSFLLLDEEEAVIDECSDLEEVHVKYDVLNKYQKMPFLTRKERLIRKHLLEELERLYQSKNYDEINYLYEELYHDKKSIREKYLFLIQDIQNNYSSKYDKLYEIIQLT